MNVEALMTENPVSMVEGESVLAASRLLTRLNVGSLPVVSKENVLTGIVTDRDIVLRCVAAGNKPESSTVASVMTRHPCRVRPEDDAKTALSIMSHHQLRRLPVTDGSGKLVGIVSLSDMTQRWDLSMECSKALSDICKNVQRITGI